MGRLTLVEVSAADDTWSAIAARSPEATFFHSPLWAQLGEATHPGLQSSALLATLDDGAQLLIPTCREPDGPAQSTFSGCYGGVISDAPVSEAAERRVLNAAARRYGDLRLTGNPLRRDGRLAVPNARDDFTHIIRLEPGFDAILRAMRKGHRSAVTKGRRMGVRVRAGSTVADYRAYYEVYEDTLRRWGDRRSSEYSWSLFEGGQKIAARHPDRLRLWLAEVDERVVAGAWVFYWNRHAVWWHGAALEAFFDHSAPNVLQADILADASERGFAYYDMNPSGGHEGVVRFKDHFGAERWPLQRARVLPPIRRFAQRARRLVRRTLGMSGRS